MNANGDTCVLSINCIWEGRFFHAGEPVPLQGLPQPFRKYVVKPQPQHQVDEAEEPVDLSFQLGTSYSIDSRGNRHLAKQAAELVSIDQERQELQNALEQVDPVTQQAMEFAQKEYDASIQGQIAQAESIARQQDEIRNATLAEQESAILDAEGFQTGSVGDTEDLNQPLPAIPIVESEPPAKRMRKRYVKRNSGYCLAKEVRVKPFEPIYVKKHGEFIEVGKINKHCKIPAIYMEDQNYGIST